jgi:hypothetical protein
MVGLEHMMVHERVPFKRVAEKFHQKGAVHDITVQRPFEPGTENRPGNHADGAPKQEHDHKTTFNFLRRLKENFQRIPNAA